MGLVDYPVKPSQTGRAVWFGMADESVDLLESLIQRSVSR